MQTAEYGETCLFPQRKIVSCQKKAFSCWKYTFLLKDAVFEGRIAGNCTNLQDGFRPKKSRTLVHFHNNSVVVHFCFVKRVFHQCAHWVHCTRRGSEKPTFPQFPGECWLFQVRRFSRIGDSPRGNTESLWRGNLLLRGSLRGPLKPWKITENLWKTSKTLWKPLKTS